MAINESIQKIPARLVNAADGGHVAGADMIFDDDFTIDGTTGQSQADINSYLDGNVLARADKIPAEAFSDEKAYAVDDYVTYSGNLYKCTTAHAAGAWNSSDFTLVTDNFMAIDANGNIKDSGKKVSDFQATLVVGTNLDSTPTVNSTNPVTSGGVYNALENKEETNNKVTSISSNSTDTQYPSAKCVFDRLQGLDIPIPFESTCDIKPYLVKSFGGVSGGSTGIPGFRGEVTYRQALYATGTGFTNKPSTLSGTFNEWRFFKNLKVLNLFFNIPGWFTSIVFPDGWTGIETRLLGYGDDNAVCYMDFPESMQDINGLPNRGTYTYRFHSITYVPTVTYNANRHLTKVYVRTGMKAQFLADTEWAKYDASVFEEFDEL